MSEWLGLDISRQDHVDGSDTLIDELPEYHRIIDKPYPFEFSSEEDHHEQIRKYFLMPRPQKNIVEKFKLTTGVMQNPYAIFNIGKNFALKRGRQGPDNPTLNLSVGFYLGD